MSVRFSRNLHKIIGRFWDSASRPHIGDMVMNLFFTLRSTAHDWWWRKNGQFWAKNDQTWQDCQRSKVKILNQKKPLPQLSKYCFQNESAWTQPTCPWVTGGRKKSYQVCKMQNAKLVLRVQRWLAPTCPWVTGGRRGLCLASREEAAASPGLQALETHNRESHLMKSVFLTPHYYLEERAWCC